MLTVLDVPDVDRSPPYEQIAAHFRAEIRARRLKPGDELLSTRALAKEWKVANATAFRALTVLREEGWIDSRPGKVPVVAGSPPA